MEGPKGQENLEGPEGQEEMEGPQGQKNWRVVRDMITLRDISN